MNTPLTPSLFFTSPRPAVIELPHLITAMDAELMAKVVHLTRSTPGLWHLPAPYDENDVFDPGRDPETPFSLWSLPANQAELLAPGRFAAEALFGTHAVLLDSAIDERAALALTETRGQRKENGGLYVDGLHDLPALPKLMEIARWALMPVAPDRRHGLFVTAPKEAPWVGTLREWCDRQGRSHGRVVLDGDTPVLLDTQAPDEARERAAAQQIDQFLGTMGRCFRLADESLLPRIQHRIEAARQMEQSLSQSKRGQRVGPGMDKL